eukprot:TRINITY_DN3233_c0_g1_i1.p1 TRINITY_DN3233_c0_g1~~TRINITY_DN3233_c0_g1_i1.p1  ORF type:complete len:516 (+),score=149.86 TRINITY_DN3233_c0_g1_i1:172-1719(+)
MERKKRRKINHWTIVIILLLSFSSIIVHSQEKSEEKEDASKEINLNSIEMKENSKRDEDANLSNGIKLTIGTNVEIPINNNDDKNKEDNNNDNNDEGDSSKDDKNKVKNDIRQKAEGGIKIEGGGFSVQLNEAQRQKEELEEERRQIEMRREEKRKKKELEQDKRMENSVKYTKDYWFPGKKEASEFVERYPKPYGWPPKDKDPKMRTIFISMASYRDPVCPSTLIDLFQQSAFPDRIFVGVYQQNSKLEPDCIASLPQKTMRYLSQIRILRIDHSDADGPCTARYWCSQLYQGEDYFMQIDSHTRFLKDWDVHQIRMWESLNDRFPEHKRKIVVSTYPIAYNVSEDTYPHDYEKYVPIMCYGKFRDQLIVPAGAMISSGPEVIFESPFIAAGWFFGPGNLLYEVPFDPGLPHVFLGEEVLYSIRLWVAGWRIYNPDLSILAHYYLRTDQPKIWGDVNNFFGKGKAATDTIRRSLLFLKDGGPLPKYSPSEEGVKEYYRHFGVNIEEQTFRKICG